VRHDGAIRLRGRVSDVHRSWRRRTTTVVFMPHLAFCANCGSDRLDITGANPTSIEVRCYVCTQRCSVQGVVLGEIDFLAGAKTKVEQARAQAGLKAKKAGGAARKVDQYAARKVDHSRAVDSIRSSAFSSVVNPGDRLWESGNLAVCARFPLFHGRVFVVSPPARKGQEGDALPWALSRSSFLRHPRRSQLRAIGVWPTREGVTHSVPAAAVCACESSCLWS
jgi:hypothetical protein